MAKVVVLVLVLARAVMALAGAPVSGCGMSEGGLKQPRGMHCGDLVSYWVPSASLRTSVRIAYCA
jgi:hypothetical protein